MRVGWGNGLERRLRLLSEQVADTLPVDPRIRQQAREIVGDTPASDPLAQSRKAYRWVQDNVKDGQEVEGPKVLTSEQGNRWSALRMLLRALDIPVNYAVIKDRLAPVAPGPMSEAEAYNIPLLHVGSGADAVWLSLQERYAPFGYVPVRARGMPGHELAVEGPKPVVMPAAGDQDRLEYEGSVELGERGMARITLRQRFIGKYAMQLQRYLDFDLSLTVQPEGDGRLNVVGRYAYTGERFNTVASRGATINSSTSASAVLELISRIGPSDAAGRGTGRRSPSGSRASTRWGASAQPATRCCSKAPPSGS